MFFCLFNSFCLYAINLLYKDIVHHYCNSLNHVQVKQIHESWNLLDFYLPLMVFACASRVSNVLWYTMTILTTAIFHMVRELHLLIEIVCKIILPKISAFDVAILKYLICFYQFPNFSLKKSSGILIVTKIILKIQYFIAWISSSFLRLCSLQIFPEDSFIIILLDRLEKVS